MKTISIVCPCFNEEGNIVEVYERVKAVMRGLGRYRYEHIFIDNCSQDRTPDILAALASKDKNVKVIFNTRNFGHVRSPMHAFHQAGGDAVVTMSSDLQDPPELIEDMVREWERGTPITIAVKESSEEGGLMFWLRKKYYRTVRRLADIETYDNFIGFGLYDRKVVEIIKGFNDPYPYFRGMIAEIGLPHTEIPYRQARRTRGITKNNFYTLYDLAMLGVTSLSKVPLRLATFAGVACSLLSLLTGLFYLAYKLVYWDNFSVGIAPAVIGMFFFASVQLFFIGILGEYIGAIFTFVQRRPLALERERLNFEYGHGYALEARTEPAEPRSAPEYARAAAK